MMKPFVPIVAVAAFAVAALVTYLIVRTMDPGMAFLALVLGALLGTQAGVFMYHRQPGAVLTVRIKLILGGTLALTCVAVALIMQSVWHCFEYPDVTISVGAVGSFVFPFVVANNQWKMLDRMKRKDGGG